jgi:hypothetical protein
MVAGGASAAPPVDDSLAQARELFRIGEQKEAAFDYQGALEQFRAVGNVRMTPSVRFHIAHCEESLGHLGTAYQEYSLAKRDAELKKQQDTAKAAGAALSKLDPRVAKFRALCTIATFPCKVSIDGKPMESTDAIAHVDAGIRRIEITFAGKTEKRESSAVDGQLLDIAPNTDAPSPGPLTHTLLVDGPQTPETRDTHANANARTPATNLPPQPVPMGAARPQRYDAPSRTFAVLATGGALALLGSGVAAFVVAGNVQSDAQLRCPALASCEGSRDRVRLLDGVALGAWVGAAALGVWAVALWIAPARTAQAASSARPAQRGAGARSLWLAGAGPGLIVGGRF